MTEAIHCADLRLNFGKDEILKGIDLEVERGESLVILGPSGCGKTTLLRALSGLEKPSRGKIRLGGEVVFDSVVDVEPAARKVGFVFQDLGLWPSMTVLGHLLFVLGSDSKEAKARARARLADLKIDHLEQKKPGQLSGGEAQRVALARALISDPALLLLDEPLSSLDPVVARDIRRLLARIQRDEGRTMVYVTHARDEAFELGDRVLLMRAGRIEQLAPPSELAARPATPFVADFLGLGHVLAARKLGEDEVETALGRHRIASGSAPRASRAYLPRRSVGIVADGPAEGRVLDSRFLGEDWVLEIALGDERVLVHHPEALDPGSTVSLAGPATVWCLDEERTRS